MNRELVTLPIFNRCIWCHGATPEAVFDASHVLPECIGNETQQVLPPGVVCKSCNSYFGTKIEPHLLNYPLFHVTAAFLRVVDPEDGNAFRDQLFDAGHPPVEPPTRSLHLGVHIHKGERTQLSVSVKHSIEGRLSCELTARELAFISRAIHKITFESVAWTLFVHGFSGEPIDLFSPLFNPIRLWVREGQPQRPVRPLLWRAPHTLSRDWETRIWKFGPKVGAELRLFGDWYSVSLTGANASDALTDLQTWAVTDVEKLCCIGDSIIKFEDV